ncbi:MAG: CaiB/BaiF CoA transferase family protein [Anaerolineales bacterium]
MRLLDDIRILDFSQAMAGPYCTMMLGDLGAEVIKIERPGKGDDSRGWGPPFANLAAGLSAYFISTNRNKQSVVLDLKTEQGLQVARRLIDHSDVLVENFRSGVMERLGLGYEQLRLRNRRLIYCSISGYGRTGPYADRPGYDVVMQAEGGLMSITGPREGPPSRVGVPIVDIAAGMFAATGVLAALRAAEKSGQGQRVEVSLLETVLALQTNVISNYLVDGQPPERWGNDHPNLVPYGSFRASDGWLVVGVANQRQWFSFCDVIGRPEIAQEDRFQTNEARLANRNELENILSEILAAKPVKVWLDRLQDAGIPSGPINTIPEALDHPQSAERSLVIEADPDETDPLRMAGFPYSFSGNQPEFRIPPPALGEHTREVLIDLLGYSEAEAARFEQEQVGSSG